MDVRIICLGLLTREDATGYQIKKLFEDGRFNYFVEASFGSIYPALNRLTKEGLVSVREEAQTKRPDRKVYSITEKGRRAFLDALLKALPEDRYRSPFLFAMMFMEQLPSERVRDLLDGYIATIETRLALLKSDCQKPATEGEDFVCGYGRTVYEAILAFLRDRRHQFNTAALKAAAE